MTEWLRDTLVATSLLMLLVLAVREPVRRRFGAAVAYALWLVPAARLLMPTLTTTVERTLPAAEAAPIPLQAISAPPMLAMPAIEPSLIDRLGGWESIAIALWLAGAAAMLVRAALVYRRQRRAVLGDAVQIARLGSIRLVRSGAVRGPLAFGIFDQVIAVPIDFDERFGAAQRRLALDHELAHHRSGDIVANHIAYVLLCLMWFNPLAWVSHAAFRFDQEAACDARVLDKADARDRAAYGQAIAKAASGRALLFAGALDRPSTLQRRLRAMLSTPDSSRRLTGKAIVALTAAFALPLTATWATLYVDVPAPAPPAKPVAPAAPAAPLAPLAALQAPAAPLAPVAPVAPNAPNATMHVDGDTVTINGRTKRWQDLTPAERAHIRSEIAKARAELSRNRIDRAAIQREVNEAMADARVDKQDLARDLAEARAEIAEAMREIDANAAQIRRAGHDPEAIKAQVRASLAAVQAIDVEAITRQAMAAVDPQVVAASIAAAEASIARATAEMERLESRLEQFDEQNEDDDDD